jgi:tRNA(Arg) A34 adenosine deaminase TadA
VPNPDHERFMRRAIALARRAGLEYHTGGVFGAVIVRDGEIVAEGMNRVVASHDPTWHAEMEAIRGAAVTLTSFKLTGCTLYASGEPCPMCLAACYWAGIARIYYAGTVEDAKSYGGFDDAPIYAELALPREARSIPMAELLREECLPVWKAYAANPNRVPY